MSSTNGQKVTTDPASNNVIYESAGTVTSDSLAAESSSFGAGNPKAAVSQQPSASTTTNTTDTSNATRLDPAIDAETRGAQEGWSEESQLKAGQQLGIKGLGKESGVGPTWNTVKSGPGAASVAPTGTNPSDVKDGKPKGANLTEDNELHGRTVFGQVGTMQDPGRVAESEFGKKDAVTGGPKDAPQSGESKFSALGGDTSA
ncbi:hypothetical protein P153DRAFT_399031 [Dothidotthia symphoricarpi CBS 119687]|uniref:Uncharacterized protein n=1 Tax=Dothidotthia symphoricarpi CBS 119687 TaxID=1392245 RepID=A0A6A6A8I1_9PLEO|nr:uncharacterized protein P153DRAFT_399031 [Dothidotthia symphoricarpi CBS 119687]KAF2126951.1 hypothetical protein P153DRAFT_399031 [Dothidotthia symphoricarpi CBS 119687]